MSYTRTLKTADGTGYVLTLPGAGLSRVAIGAESGECWVLPYINQTSAPSTPTSALITSVAGVASSKESIRLTAGKSVVLDLSAGFSGDNTSLRYTHLAVWSVTAGIFEGSSGDLVYAVNTSVTPADGSVTTAKLAAAAVTGPKLATSAVKLLCATGRNAHKQPPLFRLARRVGATARELDDVGVVAALTSDERCTAVVAAARLYFGVGLVRRDVQIDHALLARPRGGVVLAAPRRHAHWQP